MLYSKLTKNMYEPEAAVFLSIVFGAIIGGFAAGVTVVIPYHIAGIILCIVAGLFIGLMMLSDDEKIGLILITLLPMISLTVFEILYEIHAKSLMYPWWIYAIILVVVTEILFFLDKTQPNTIDKDKVMQFTFERKIEALIEASMILIILKSFRREFIDLDISIYYPTIIDMLVFILGVISIALLMYVFVWINSFRYKKV